MILFMANSKLKENFDSVWVMCDNDGLFGGRMRLSNFCLNMLIVSQFLNSNPILFHGSIGVVSG